MTRRFLLAIPGVLFFAMTVWLTCALAQEPGSEMPPSPSSPGQAPSRGDQNGQEELLPPWSRFLPPAQRFQLVLNDTGVLDRETGLVWARTPMSTGKSWFEAYTHCLVTTVGQRRGWRLPVGEELESLVDPTHPNFPPALPAGHPFNLPLQGYFWTATTDPEKPTQALVLGFWPQTIVGARINIPSTYKSKAGSGPLAWCVRSGQGK